MEIQVRNERYGLSWQEVDPSPPSWDVVRPALLFTVVRQAGGQRWAVEVVLGRGDPDEFMPGWQRNYGPGGEAITEGLAQYGGAVGVIEEMARTGALETLPGTSCVLVTGDGVLFSVGEERDNRRQLTARDGRGLYVSMNRPERATAIASEP